MSDGRLLVVEDDLLVANFLRAALVRSGCDYEIELVHTLADAVELVESTEYDAILLDLGLPDADGLRALERLRPLTGTPILITTGSTDQRVAALAGGANAFLGKVEYDVKQFVETLSKLLG